MRLTIPTLFIAIAATAQPPPRINHIFPAGAQRGATNITITITGAEFTSNATVRITGTGITTTTTKFENPNTIRLTVAIAPDAQTGERDLRVITPNGASNRLRFFVGTLPEILESEPNTDRSQAQRLDSLPVLINGQLLHADRDLFRFNAKAGQTIVCALDARKITPSIADAVPGWLDASLTLYDAQGKELAYADDFHSNPDPVLIHRIPSDGEYILEVKDIISRGRADFVYRLSLGVLPHITHIYPLGGQRGTTINVQLHGPNLPAATTNIVLPTDAPALLTIQTATNGLLSNEVPFATAEAKETQESEPNDSITQANRVEPPVTINGRIGHHGDVDCFIFRAQKDQRLVAEIIARRLNSPLDASITLLNHKGDELREADDTDTGEPLLTHFADPRLEFHCPADGDYVLKLADIQRHGGEPFAYRLSIAPPKPDFRLRIMPDTFRISPGDTVLLTVTALRKDGFGNEIHLAAQQLPAGFTASEGTIRAGQTEGHITITAPRDPSVPLFTPRIIGKAKTTDTELLRIAEPTEELTQAFSYKHFVPTEELIFTISDQPPFTLTVNLPSNAPITITPESETQIPVKVSRKAGLQGEISLAIFAPPPGISIKPTVIPPDKDETTAVIVAAKDVAVGTRHQLFLTGTLKTAGYTDTRYAPAITIQFAPKQP